MGNYFQFIKRKRIKNFLLLTFTWIIIPLFLVEILMIVFEPYLFKGLYQYDPDLGFRVRPYINGNNQFGFNDRDYPLETEPGKFRLLVVSDSFNWAGGKDRNYTALLEKKFDNYYGQNQVEVINVGYPGTHTGEQLAMLKKYGLQYNPNLVVLGFFVGNDFRDADPERKRIIVNGIYIDINKKDELVILGYPIIGKSRLLMFLQQKYKVYQELQKAKQDSVKLLSNSLVASLHLGSTPIFEREKSPGILSKKAFLQVEKSRLKFCNIKDLLEGKRDENINYIFQSILEMQKLLKSRNIEFVVAIYPDEYQVNDKLLNEIFAQYDDLKRESYNLTCQQEILSKFLEVNNIPYIDMLERFKTEQNNRTLYLLREPHWNSAGNLLAANILFNHLVEDINNFFWENSSSYKSRGRINSN